MLKGKRTAVVTGASSGIGKETAKAMASQGWNVIGTGRDPERMAKAEAEIRAVAVAGEVTMLRGDLSLMAQAEQIGRDISALTDRIDILVNNAGGMPNALVITSEGYEASFAGNHLGPFLLTQRLLPLLRKTAKAMPSNSVRILNVASDASEFIPTINLDDLENLEDWNPGTAYCTGKLANVLLARALALRLADDGIVAHSIHPGAVATNFFSYVPADTLERTKDMPKISEADGADTIIWLATSEDGGRNSGTYWHQRQLRRPNPLVDDLALLERFWTESERLLQRKRLTA